MDFSGLRRMGAFEWQVPATGRMRVPVVLFADENLLRDMDGRVLLQAVNVASLPGIAGASCAMPDAHSGYGFPIGGVAAFDAEKGGIVSAGGVGFDISCGVRSLVSGIPADDIVHTAGRLADALLKDIPAGVGSTGAITLSPAEMNAMLAGGAAWAVDRGWGTAADLARIENKGCMARARPDCVSAKAKDRQKKEMGTLGSGNHYLEIQKVVRIFDRRAAKAYGLEKGDAVVSIHCGSRGLGHQIATEYAQEMLQSARNHRFDLPDRELACAPIRSTSAERYLGAMNAAVNCAQANRQIITHLTRRVFAEVMPGTELKLLYDLSHNTCMVEEHEIDGRPRRLHVHRKGATRAFPPGHPDVPEDLRAVGQPVLVGGSMGTASYILRGTSDGSAAALRSACHGAGRTMSRRAAKKRWSGRALIDDLAKRGILIRSPHPRGVSEEAPEAYKDVDTVIEAAVGAGLVAKVARLEPMICIKG